MTTFARDPHRLQLRLVTLARWERLLALATRAGVSPSQFLRDSIDSSWGILEREKGKALLGGGKVSECGEQYARDLRCHLAAGHGGCHS